MGNEAIIYVEQVGEVCADLGWWQACKWVKGMVLGHKGYGPRQFMYFLGVNSSLGLAQIWGLSQRQAKGFKFWK